VLSVVLGHFVSASKGDPDPEFWADFYNLGGGSGGPYVTGAINAFFPYLIDKHAKTNTRPNPCALPSGGVVRVFEGGGRVARRFGGGPCTDEFPIGLAKVPFTWHYHAKTFSMHFLGGFVGVSQDPKALALRPVTGWGVADQKQAQ
jgi:hypothetical protein